MLNPAPDTTTPLAAPAKASWFPRLAPPLLLLAAAGAMTKWTWGTWPDVIVDFGRELYVPWQLVQGKVLYRDIAYFNGPLSPYLNTLWFRLAGPSLLTLVLFNLAIVAGIAAMLQRLLRRFEGRAAATVGTLSFLLLFAFSRYEWIGNSNYICPYSHETTHGILLCLALLLLLDRFLRAGARAWLAAGGLTLGLLFLTKVEICVAAGSAAFFAVVLHAWATRRSPCRIALDALALLAPAVLPLLAAVGLLSLAMPAHDALLNTLGSWRYSFNTRLSTLLYFKIGTGLLDHAHSLARLAIASAGILALLGLLGWAAHNLTRRHPEATPSIALAAFALVAAGLFAAWKVIPWLDLARPLPLAMLLLVALGVRRLMAVRDDPAARAKATTAVVATVFAFMMLLKMILFARVSNYGYFLAMPAAAIALAALVGRLPTALARRAVNPLVFRAGVAAALLVTLAWHLSLVNYHFARLTVRVGEGPDAFRADARGETVNTVVRNLPSLLRPQDTLAVLPEGAMVNFLLRRPNPTPYIIFMPSDLLMFGEGHVISGLASHPPDYILLAHKYTAEYGYNFFGRDYAISLMDWIQANYEFAALSGQEPFRERDKFGILVVRRNAKVRP